MVGHMAAWHPERLGVQADLWTSRLDIRVRLLESTQLSESFDCNAFLQVREHMPDVRSASRKAWSGLAPGASVGTTLASIQSPAVVQWFSPRTLTRLFCHNRFSLIDTGRSLKTESVANGVSLLLEKIGFRIPISVSNALTGRLARFRSVPYPPFDVFWAMYRKRDKL